MDKNYFVVHLLPSRPDFAQTMTGEERSVMEKHKAYWKEKMEQGKVVVFGPVFDPKAIYGLGIIAVENEDEVKHFIQNDPAASINSYEYFPMMAIVPGM
jgi:uncharacterized protein YciI